jgi:uncharacterized protein YdeI (YjbR/CyaY-like superfamily)
MEQVYVKTRQEWRAWLRQHHAKSSGIWLVFYKKHTGKSGLTYEAAVEEALCFGWIDSIIKKIDADRYVRKLTPRKADSSWSESNRRRVARLEERGLMTAAGKSKVTEAKRSGRWHGSVPPSAVFSIPPELADALAKNKKAGAFFDQLAPSYQKQYCAWISTAKRPETRERRLRTSLSLLEQGEKLGLK